MLLPNANEDRATAIAERISRHALYRAKDCGRNAMTRTTETVSSVAAGTPAAPYQEIAGGSPSKAG